MRVDDHDGPGVMLKHSIQSLMQAAQRILDRLNNRAETGFREKRRHFSYRYEFVLLSAKIRVIHALSPGLCILQSRVHGGNEPLVIKSAERYGQGGGLERGWELCHKGG